MKINYVVTKKISVDCFLKPAISEFARRGWDVHLICRDAQEVVFEDGTRIKKTNFDFPVRWFDLLNPLIFLKTIFKLRQLLISSGGLVYCHTPVASHFSRLAATLGGVGKVIYHVHGFRFQKGRSDCKNTIFFLLENLLSYSTRMYICMNREDYVASTDHFSRRCELIKGVGVDIERLDHARSSSSRLGTGVIIIGVVGTYSWEKGYEDVFELARRLTHEKVEIRCFGAGDPGDFIRRAALEKLTNLHFLGFSENILAEMVSFDLFFHPSRREGLPVAVMEAMGLGLPVLATSVRGNVDLIEHGITGLLYEVGCNDHMLNGAQNLIADHRFRSDIGASAREVVLEHYCQEKLARQTVERIILATTEGI